MNRSIQKLFEQNEIWAEQRLAEDPEYFSSLAKQQSPKFLWIGCADSRIPANEILGLKPGEIFVHRNIANLILHSDMNCLSVIQYAVEVLKVEHIIICGHYGCGGVKAAMSNTQHGMIDNWLRQIKDTYCRFQDELESITNEEKRVNLLCEKSVLKQIENLVHTPIIQNAWMNKQPLHIHGMIYDLSNGLLKHLGLTINGKDQVHPIYQFSE